MRVLRFLERISIEHIFHIKFVQGLWLGLLTTFGSLGNICKNSNWSVFLKFFILARVIGPLFVSSLYAEYGTYLIFGLITGTENINLKGFLGLRDF